VPGVSYSPALKWFLLALLPLTLGLKLAVWPGGDAAQNEERSAQFWVAEFLLRQHFTVATSELVQGRPTIQAIAGGCRILVTEIPAIGWTRDVFRSHATASDDVFFVFRGEVYRDHPTWLIVPNSLWARFRRELGFEVHSSAVFGVIAAQSCDAERLPWKELGYNSVNWWSIGFHQLGSSGFGGDSL
jgi:hypothetical protein